MSNFTTGTFLSNNDNNRKMTNKHCPSLSFRSYITNPLTHKSMKNKYITKACKITLICVDQLSKILYPFSGFYNVCGMYHLFEIICILL